MSDFESGSTRKKMTPIKLLLLAIIIGALAATAWFMAPRFEREAPQVRLVPDTGVIGLGTLEIDVADLGAGLKSVTATLSAGGTEISLAAEQFDSPVAGKKIAVATSKLSGIKEGPAVLRVTARDASLWNLFRGNEAVVEKNLTIDITPPTVELIADDRYINFGGVGVIVYKSSEEASTSGVKIGDYFFPGFQGQIKSHPDHYIALFAHAYNVPADARGVLVVTDKAGNTREMRLAYELKDVKYRKSTIALSDNFLQKITPLLSDVGSRQGTPQEIFISINKGMRKQNEDKITEVTRKATPSLLWSGAFRQLSNSKVEANFADERTYTLNNAPVDNAFHLGYDLSVTKNYPVEAANSGNVAFTGDLGIYGNTVILDHGLGLFTLYSHLSAIDVKVGDAIKQRQIVGKTGETGLAAGDHLHYGVYLNGVAVLPVEWWDKKWIADNIEPKLEGKTGEAIAQEAERVKSPRKAATKAQPKSKAKPKPKPR